MCFVRKSLYSMRPIPTLATLLTVVSFSIVSFLPSFFSLSLSLSLSLFHFDRRDRVGDFDVVLWVVVELISRTYALASPYFVVNSPPGRIIRSLSGHRSEIDHSSDDVWIRAPKGILLLAVSRCCPRWFFNPFVSLVRIVDDRSFADRWENFWTRLGPIFFFFFFGKVNVRRIFNSENRGSENCRHIGLVDVE